MCCTIEYQVVQRASSLLRSWGRTIEGKVHTFKEGRLASFVWALDEDTATLWKVQVDLSQEPEIFDCQMLKDNHALTPFMGYLLSFPSFKAASNSSFVACKAFFSCSFCAAAIHSSARATSSSRRESRSPLSTTTT